MHVIELRHFRMFNGDRSTTLQHMANGILVNKNYNEFRVNAIFNTLNFEKFSIQMWRVDNLLANTILALYIKKADALFSMVAYDKMHLLLPWL